MSQLEFWNGRRVVAKLDMPNNLSDDPSEWGAVVMVQGPPLGQFTTYQLGQHNGSWHFIPSPGSGDLHQDYTHALDTITGWARLRWNRLGHQDG